MVNPPFSICRGQAGLHADGGSIPESQILLDLKSIEILKTIKLTENISDSIWIHETQSAINNEFKIRSIQASSVCPGHLNRI